MTINISCSDKDAQGRITHIGSRELGQRWTSQQVIGAIRAGTNEYWVATPSTKRTRIRVIHLNGVDYLTTNADGLRPNNLDELPACA
jgi:hypothetical protein